MAVWGDVLTAGLGRPHPAVEGTSIHAGALLLHLLLPTFAAVLPIGTTRCRGPVQNGQASVSPSKQDLDRQIDALRGEGIPARHIYVTRNAGSPQTGPDFMKPSIKLAPGRGGCVWL